VDVGASYYPHGKWLMFLNSPQTRWLAVEPNEVNIAYVKKWTWPCKVSACTTGLSRDGGEQTLYVTNVDTGSSLLKPEISESMKHRITDLGYFFPLKERQIKTLKLEEALKDLPQEAPIFVKLDTQGTELSILQGAHSLIEARRIVGIEMESTMQAQPVMSGAGKFWQACEYLEANGFELLHVRPIHAVSRSGRVRRDRHAFLNECDAVFALRQDIARTMSLEFRVNLFAFYLSNFFYEEALSVLQVDTAVKDFLEKQGCRMNKLLLILKALS
jgi:FkbM family methyltransferase